MYNYIETKETEKSKPLKIERLNIDADKRATKENIFLISVV